MLHLILTNWYMTSPTEVGWCREERGEGGEGGEGEREGGKERGREGMRGRGWESKGRERKGVVGRRG